MATIWKVELGDDLGRWTLKIPRGSDFLGVGMQGGKVVVWFLCDPEEELVKKTFFIHGTGRMIYSGLNKSNYIGTAQDGGYIWHVFCK